VDEASLQREPQPDGDESGLLLLYTQHRAELLRFARARCGDAAEAEDILQELWLKLRTLCIGPVSRGRPYLYQMVNNLVLDRVRERRRRARRDRDWTAQALPGEALVGEIAAPEPPALDVLVEAEDLERLKAAIDALPEAARRAFCLHKIEGWSHAEVAGHLGISRSGVEKHMAVAMKHLRQYLGS